MRLTAGLLRLNLGASIARLCLKGLTPPRQEPRAGCSNKLSRSSTLRSVLPCFEGRIHEGRRKEEDRTKVQGGTKGTHSWPGPVPRAGSCYRADPIPEQMWFNPHPRPSPNFNGIVVLLSRQPPQLSRCSTDRLQVGWHC